jgi:serine/threonine protein kinase
LQPSSIFARGAEVVRDLAHVRVERVIERGADGLPITLYRKTFKHKGWNVWSDRENRFLSLFHGGSLRHVVQMHKLEAATPGAVSSVDTHDAGLTIEEWLTVAPRYGDGTSFNHVFRRGEDFLRLMRACLTALKEIHDFGVVHCDIKQDNICLPPAPRPYRHGEPLKADFADIRLIDFSFSLGRDLPLAQLLPIDPSAAYQSPLLKAALAEDMKTDKPLATAKLDYRVDLYGLGYMGSQVMASGSFFWDTEERGGSGKALARELMEDLLALGSGKTVWRYLGGGRPHQRLVKKLDDWLKGAKPQETFVPARQAGQGAAARTLISPLPTPVTPVLTAVSEPVAVVGPASAGQGRDLSLRSDQGRLKPTPVRS